MANATRTTIWTGNQVLTASALDAEFNHLLDSLNLINSDISAGAGIVESKILFSGSGHGHTGGTDGKLINLHLDGWTPVSDSWIYASASTITVPSGAASLYQKGDR